MTPATPLLRSPVLCSVLSLALAAVAGQEQVSIDPLPVTEVDLSATLGIPSAAYGLNDIGSIVGTATLLPDAIPRRYGFLMSHEAGLRNLGFDWDVLALDVNNHDEVVGARGLGTPPSAMLWRRGDEAGPWTGLAIAAGVAFAVNDATTVVGDHWTATGPLPVSHAFRWSPAGGLEDVESLTGEGSPWSYLAPLSQARAIRDDGLMGGERGGSAVFWRATGEPTELSGRVVTAISDAGLAVGSSGTAFPGPSAPEQGQPVIWRDGGIISMSDQPGAAFDVNESGYVVGRVLVDGIPHAFVWHEARGVQDLGPGSAYAIDEAGRIAGAATGTDGTRATLWRLELPVEHLFVGLETVARRLIAPATEGGVARRVHRTIAAAREDWSAGRVKRATVRLQQTIQAVDTLERVFGLAPARASAIREIATELLLRGQAAALTAPSRGGGPGTDPRG